MNLGLDAYRLLVGVPKKGTTVGRQVRAAKRAVIANGGATALLGAGMVSGAAAGQAEKAMLLGTGAVGGAMNVVNPAKRLKALMPQYNEIVARAKRIFKK